jgi:hypothetical protein
MGNRRQTRHSRTKTRTSIVSTPPALDALPASVSKRLDVESPAALRAAAGVAHALAVSTCQRARAAALRHQVLEAEAVRLARAAGLSWDDLGRLLGPTGETLRRRYRA